MQKKFSNAKAALANKPALTFEVFKAEEIMRLTQIVEVKKNCRICKKAWTNTQ